MKPQPVSVNVTLPFSSRALWLGIVFLLVLVQSVLVLQSEHGLNAWKSSIPTVKRSLLNRTIEASDTSETTTIKSTKEEPPLTLENLEERFNETCVELGSGHREPMFVKEDACFSRKQVQQILIDLVFSVSDVFTRHNITHFLDSGTLLGSFRHQSIIPFDQDADIGIDEAGLKQLQTSPIELPLAYYLQVWNSEIHPEDTRIEELPVRIIHKESALYVDVFVYLESQKNGKKYVGPLPSGCFINCHQCVEVTDRAWEFNVPLHWIYPLRDCPFGGRILKCPNKTRKYLKYMFGINYMVPVVYPY